MISFVSHTLLLTSHPHTPTGLEVVMDKVLVHNGVITLDVLVIGLAWSW